MDTRRIWIRRFILGSATALTGPEWSATLLAEVSYPSEAAIRVKPGDYPALLAPGGSVQLQFNELRKPFTLTRVAADRFVTLDSVCKHAGCTVGRFISANGHMRCPCHGSRYDIEGRVFRDAEGNSTEPAPSDLERFGTVYDPAADTVTITIPGLALAVDSISVQQADAAGGLRLKLMFPVTEFSSYEVLHSPDLRGAPSPVAFSLTAAGSADRMWVTPERNGVLPVFVDSAGSKGFFVVRLRLARISG